jgi:hypothetical protein
MWTEDSSGFSSSAPILLEYIVVQVYADSIVQSLSSSPESMDAFILLGGLPVLVSSRKGSTIYSSAGTEFILSFHYAPSTTTISASFPHRGKRHVCVPRNAYMHIGRSSPDRLLYVHHLDMFGFRLDRRFQRHPKGCRTRWTTRSGGAHLKVIKQNYSTTSSLLTFVARFRHYCAKQNKIRASSHTFLDTIRRHVL